MRPVLACAVGAAVLLAGLPQPTVAFEKCPNSCAVPPQHMRFCAPMPYSVCQTKGSWEEQEDVAEARFLELSNVTGLQSKCTTTLRHVVCLEAFPACEIAQEIKRLCTTSCDAAKAACAGVQLKADVCPADSVSESNTCFTIDYTGPNVGMWFAGFLISVIFSFLAALGINLQKYSLGRNDKLPEEQRRPPFKQPHWLIGFMLIVSGSILDFVAFGLAPQTFLAPLAALSLVWNMMLAPRFHENEKITRTNVISTVIICVGVTSTVVFSAHATPTYVLDDLIFLAEQPVMALYCIVIGATLAVMFVGTKIIEKSGREGSLLHIVCYGGLGGTFGGQSVLLAKSTVELVKSALFGNGHAFTHIPTYFIAAGMACTLLLQLHFLNEGLRKFDALLMVPTYQAFWIMMSIFGGLMFFEEYKDFGVVDWAMFFVGTAITIGGICLLLRRGSSTEAGGSPRRPTARSGIQMTGGGTKYAELSLSSNDDESGSDGDVDLADGDEASFGSGRKDSGATDGSNSGDEAAALNLRLEGVVGDTGGSHNRMPRRRSMSGDAIV